MWRPSDSEHARPVAATLVRQPTVGSRTGSAAATRRVRRCCVGDGTAPIASRPPPRFIDRPSARPRTDAMETPLDVLSRAATLIHDQLKSANQGTHSSVGRAPPRRGSSWRWHASLSPLDFVFRFDTLLFCVCVSFYLGVGPP